MRASVVCTLLSLAPVVQCCRSKRKKQWGSLEQKLFPVQNRQSSLKAEPNSRTWWRCCCFSSSLLYTVRHLFFLHTNTERAISFIKIKNIHFLVFLLQDLTGKSIQFAALGRLGYHVHRFSFIMKDVLMGLKTANILFKWNFHVEGTFISPITNREAENRNAPKSFIWSKRSFHVWEVWVGLEGTSSCCLNDLHWQLFMLSILGLLI